MVNILDTIIFNADGLIPAVTQDIRTDEVLMLAYMNEESIRKTIETGLVHYFSRSRQKLWLKGETSGHFQKVRSISIDCDGDTLLLKVEQTGAACHTGHHSCFFTRLDADKLETGKEQAFYEEKGLNNVTMQNEVVEEVKCTPMKNPAPTEDEASEKVSAQVLQELFNVIYDRHIHPKEGSYTNYLFGKGLDKILKKIGEEACEVVIASKNTENGEIKAEIADLLYHIIVLLVDRGLTLQDIYEELHQRERK